VNGIWCMVYGEWCTVYGGGGVMLVLVYGVV